MQFQLEEMSLVFLTDPPVFDLHDVISAGPHPRGRGLLEFHLQLDLPLMYFVQNAVCLSPIVHGNKLH